MGGLGISPSLQYRALSRLVNLVITSQSSEALRENMARRGLDPAPRLDFSGSVRPFRERTPSQIPTVCTKDVLTMQSD